MLQHRQSEAGVDNSFAKKKVKEWNARAQDFTDKTGIPRQRARENVFTSGGESDILEIVKSKGITLKERISANKILVENNRPKIIGMTNHALKNLKEKPDRANMTIEKAQFFVDNAKIAVFQQDRSTVKYISNSGYSIVNLYNELVTAVPQKWRNKYNKYIEKG